MLSPRYSCTPASLDRPGFEYRPRIVEQPVLGGAPQISIVTPYFNGTQLFLETALSVLRQSYQNWEWIVVDDASNDSESVELLTNFASSNSRITVLQHTKNRGPSAARNTGVETAAGNSVFLLDCDDLIEPTALEKYLWTLYSFPEVAFVSSFQVGFDQNQYLFQHGFHTPMRFLEENSTDTMALIRKDVFLTVGGFDESMVDGFEDWDFWLHAAEEGFWGYTIPEYLEWYRWKGLPAKRWKDWDNGERQLQIRERLRQRYPRVFSGVFPPIDLDFSPGKMQIREEAALTNPLEKSTDRIFLICDYLSQNNNEVGKITAGLRAHSIEVSIAALQSDSPEDAGATETSVAAWTPDVFVLDRFIPSSRTMQFITYLVQSRSVDAVALLSERLRYAAPLLARQLQCEIISPVPGEKSERIVSLLKESGLGA